LKPTKTKVSQTDGFPRAQRRIRVRFARKKVLLAGVSSSLVYVGTDVLGGVRWKDYSFRSQSISELSAIGAPSSSLVLPCFIGYDLLQIAFARGVWTRRSDLRVTAGLLGAVGVLGFAAPFARMHVRGAKASATDTMHIALTSAMSVCITLAVAFGAKAGGSRFRIYSIGTVLTFLLFGILTSTDGPRLATQQPTPWMGVTERITVYSYLLWVVALAVELDVVHPAEGRRA
jgi:Protein of unknown function (DUF998)